MIGGGFELRIGEVSRKYGIPVNSLYFYINYGLIVPPKPGGQYVFNEKTLEDLELTLELKQLGFPLKDIHRILSLYRVSNLADSQDVEDLKEIYLRQKDLLFREKTRISRILQKLEDKISQLDSKHSESLREIGLPLRMLPLLCCPCCGNDLVIDKARMNQRYIFSANVSCPCGFRARIEEGILMTENINTSAYDKPDVTRELYKDLPPDLISLFQRSYNWMVDKLSNIPLSNKVLLESYVNAWFFLHNHQHILEPTSMLIVLDKFPETLRAYKQLIERQGYNIDILYISDSSTKPPLKQNVVDINIDFFAVNEHNIYYHDFWLDYLHGYMKENAMMLGTYFYFNNGKKSVSRLLQEYPEAYSNNFNREYFIQSLSKNYQILDMHEAGYTVDSGDNLGFSFHVKGEEMHLLPYLACTKKTGAV